jgi:hypothetical protein
VLLFTPPTVAERIPVDHPLLGRMRLPRGVSLLKENGLYRQAPPDGLSDEEIAAVAANDGLVYLGGHTYWISTAEAESLTAAGYGDGIYTPPVVGGSSYGASGYGEGPYGVGAGGAVDLTGYGLGPYGEGPYGGE